MKHRKFLAVLALAGGLAACQTVQPELDDACRTDRVKIYLNALSATEVRVMIAHRVGERPIRYYSEGDPLTMDHNPQRLNVELGKDTRIKRFWCG